MSSLNVKNTSLLNFSFEWILRFILWFLCQLIQSSAMKRFLHDRIRDEKISWRWRFVIHDCECFFSCEKSCVFHAKHACLRIINREIDHFDRFRIEIEFFVKFFLKFIENDRLSWMKNAVNSDWWMRKWIVNKTKMKRWIIFDLKNCFFFSFLIKHFLLFIHLLSFFQTIFKKLFEAFHHVVCVKIFFFLNIIKFDRFFSNTLKIVFDKKKNSKCCQRCFKFLTMKSVLKCVFDVDRSICNRCAILNAVCFVVRLS
jgi:hypothetical protein